MGVVDDMHVGQSQEVCRMSGEPDHFLSAR